MRIGHGFDAHRFAERRALVLGGVEIAHPLGLAGHSDGDVVLHAVIDALLGAAALGDIGGMFLSTDPTWAGADSSELLRRAYAAVLGARLQAISLDVTVVAEAPRLSPHVQAMRSAIAAALGMEMGDVSVKATTTDGLGFTGRGEGIAAFAVVLLDSSVRT